MEVILFRNLVSENYKKNVILIFKSLKHLLIYIGILKKLAVFLLLSTFNSAISDKKHDKDFNT